MRRSRLQHVFQAAGILLISAPLLMFVFFTQIAPDLDRTISVPVRHFQVVSATALVALGLAIVVGIASVRSREPRTFLVAAAFLAISGVFAVHGLTTPGSSLLIKEAHHNLVISARLSLFIGSLFFLLSSFQPPKRITSFISKNHGSLMLLVIAVTAIYIGANLVKPDLLDFVPTGTAPRPKAAVVSNGYNAPATDREYGYSYSEPSSASPAATEPDLTPAEQLGRNLGYGMSVFAILALLFAAWRYYETYDLTRTPATGALTAGLILLAEAQIIMTLGETWNLSWWLYHFAILFGFLIPVGAIGLAHRRGSNLGQIVDGFFVRDAFAKVERAFPEAINALIGAIEKKDPYLRGHMRRVGQLTIDIAEELRLPASVARAASHAAFLHDIGKLGMPESILHKPDRLTDEEFEVMMKHPNRGYQMVMQAPVLHAAAPAIHWHHERLDGSGYPDRIFGQAIPIEARIVAVADVWDAMTSDRVYRKALSTAEARELMRSEAGVKLDDSCVQALFNVLDRLYEAAIPLTRHSPARPSERPLPSFLAS